MIRATLLLATALLLGLGGVVWVARDLDPLRVIERFAPAQVRTVDLTGSETFVRREPAAAPPPEREPVAEPAPPPPTQPAREEPVEPRLAPPPAAADGEGPEPSPEVVIDVPGLAADVVDYLSASLGSNAAFEEALEPGLDPDAAAEATAGADAPATVVAPEPLDPDASAELVRRMLAVYERTGERR